ncbi:MAG TPA: Fe-S cluster assembly protein HesB [Candidatus Dormibacteraeota bacterium]|nr:Fe-S cluster assembly protein HesB [Candidatus Dormibacteraeota bacterium]
MARLLGRLKLRGGGGEPIDWGRTINSHGVATLAPNRVDTGAGVFETTLALRDGRARRLSLGERCPGSVRAVSDGEISSLDGARLVATLRRMLRLDDDLSRFYELASADSELGWVTAGAGRMLRSPTVFEDVVKTICTTNCAWSATERMVAALVQHLGRSGPEGGHAFPSAQAMAEASPEFYRDQARTGYRSAYLIQIARSVAEGELDLEALNDPELPDADAASRLRSLPGVGPYASAHIMLTSLGRYGLLVLDSWTRPAFARLSGRPATDRNIERRFRRYGDYQGLAFWLYLTRDWVDD